MSSPPASIIERISEVSMAVTARARTSIPEGLAHPMRHDLGVVGGCDDRSDETGTAQHCKHRANTHGTRNEEQGQCQGRREPSPDRHDLSARRSIDANPSLGADLLVGAWRFYRPWRGVLLQGFLPIGLTTFLRDR